MRNNAVAIALFLICISFPAEANWQYTQWNMTREQLIAAAGGKAHLVAANPGLRRFNTDIGAEGTYSAGGFDFKTQFYFDIAGRLRLVILIPNDQLRCTVLMESIRGIYGRPVEESGLTELWHDIEKGNGVRVTHHSANDCFMAYTPLSNSGAGGL